MISVTGGTLGPDGLERIVSDPVVQSMSKNDYLVILGDCGLTEPRADLEERILAYRELPCSVMFLDGSHDDYDLLSDYPIFPWNGGMIQNFSRGIMRLMRGQVFEISGISFFTMGGASTVGRDDRGKYYDWFPDQDIQYEDVAWSKDNLELHGWCVDYVFTCDCPTSWKPAVSGVPSVCSAFLQDIHDEIEYRHWYFSNVEKTFELPRESATAVGRTVISL